MGRQMNRPEIREDMKKSLEELKKEGKSECELSTISTLNRLAKNLPFLLDKQEETDAKEEDKITPQPASEKDPQPASKVIPQPASKKTVMSGFDYSKLFSKGGIDNTPQPQKNPKPQKYPQPQKISQPQKILQSHK